MMTTEEGLFKLFTGKEPESAEVLPASGSNRRYTRLKNGELSLIGAKGSSRKENIAFWTIARHFRSKGINVPQVYLHSDDFAFYLQEDLGNDNLFDHLKEGRKMGRYSYEETALLKATVRALPKIQFEGGEGLDFSICYPQPEFDRRMISFDLNYFKYCYLKPTGTEFDEIALQDDFERLADFLLQDNTPEPTFLFRDFQARNVMIKDGEPYFIDFQGGRKGPVHYDVASFLWQAKAAYGKELRDELIDTYLEALRPYKTIRRDVFTARLRHFVLFRTLQVLGAYGFRGLFERKRHFLESIPFALANLRELLEEPFPEYPYLSGLLSSLTHSPTPPEENVREPLLEVTVCSFSFRKGVPVDESGNGGGYVFDCRGLENPGKYERYRNSTGRDKEVIEFIEEDGGVFPYLESACSLTDSHIEKFINRGFTHLMICFGCTGGQHRSVYCAESITRHIIGKYHLKVHLVHRELGIREVWE